MKVQIRRGVFETNSSSVHTLTIAKQSEYEKWKKGEVIFDADNEKFVPRDEFLEYVLDNSSWFKERTKDMTDEEALEYILDEGSYEFPSYEDYGYNHECYEHYYKPEFSEEIVIFGYFGYDG